MHALFYEVLYQSKPHTEPTTSLAKSIKTYVYASIHRNITVNDIALHFSLCPDYVSRVFYKSEPIPIKKYITDLRIRRIEEYLSSANHTIQTTSEVMGFGSAGALCKFYKYHTGKSPSEYRRRFYSEDSSGKE
jgi:two-component system response regulator YesN